jgi:hypothetical protein
MLPDGPTIALALAAAGVVGTWFVMGYRIRELETRCKDIEGKTGAHHDKLTEIDTRTRDSAKNQGERLETATIALAVLTGKVEGLDKGIDIGYAAGRRSKTAAGGNPKAPA